MLDMLILLVTTVTGMKIIGSITGSSVAVVFRHNPNKEDHKVVKALWLKRFILGAIMGFIFAPITIDSLGFEHSLDHWLAAATLSGLMGYVALEVILSDKLVSFILKKIEDKK